MLSGDNIGDEDDSGDHHLGCKDGDSDDFEFSLSLSRLTETSYFTTN